jgi:hypothetical protein
MISKVHDRLGTAGFIIAVIALVAALGGGAYAASGALTKKQKKEVEKIAAAKAGKPGPAGPQGPAGAAGAKGDAGAPGASGTAGTAGAAGKSVVIGSTAPSCPEGGKTIEVEGSGAKQSICNGEEGGAGQPGSPWTPDSQLPTGATETGTWGFRGKFTSSTAPIVAISFPVKLAAPLGPTAVHLINTNGKEFAINEGDGSREELTAPAACSGTAAAPTAASGNLCVYSQTNLSTLGSETFIGSNLIHTPATSCEGLGCLAGFGGPGAGTGTTGALLEVALEAEESAKAWGTWAVTG